MKKHLLFTSTLLLLNLLSNPLVGQTGVGIGTSNPAASAVLEIHSETSTKGLLIPRVADRENVVTPTANGLLVIQDQVDPTDNGDPTDPLTANNLYQYNAAVAGGWQAVFPRGGIIMWSGDKVPAGWALCNGSNDTPDLRGRFIVASGQDDAPAADDANPAYTVNATGGKNEVRLGVNELPSHTHTANGVANHSHTLSIVDGGEHKHSVRRSNQTQGADDGAGNGPGFVWRAGVDDPPWDDAGYAGTNYTSQFIDTEVEEGGSHSHTGTVAGAGGHTHTINAQGGGTRHENRPAYYVLAFIMKL